MSKVIGLMVVALVLVGCVIPEGDYTIPSGYRAEVYNEQGTRVYSLTVGGEVTPTPDMSTDIPDSTPVKQCELHIQGFPHPVYSVRGGTLLGNFGKGTYVVGTQFLYPSDQTEWAYAKGVNYITAAPLEGWILVTSNVLYDPQGPCLDVPADYEVTPVPTTTPAPTVVVPTFTPIPNECRLTAPTDTFINVRALPSTIGGTIIGQFSGGKVLPAEARYMGSYTWYRVNWVGKDGWIAAVPSLSLSGDCGAVPIENPFESTPVSTQVRAGFHLLLGEGSSLVVEYMAQTSTNKFLNGTEGLAETYAQINPDGVTVYRSLHTTYGMKDCPDPWMYDSLTIWQDGLRLPPGYDYYEIQNECPPPPAGYGQWAQWSIGMAQYVYEQTGGRLLAFSFAAGNPDVAYWIEMLPYFEWVETHPLPDGTYHGIALHASANATWNRSDSPWVNNRYITIERMLDVVREYVLMHTGKDLKEWPGTIAFTELGLTDGYSGNWNAFYSCVEKADAFRTTVTLAKDLKWAGELLIEWWNLGRISIWSSDHECLSVFFK